MLLYRVNDIHNHKLLRCKLFGKKKLLSVIVKKDIININISSKKHSNMSNNGIRKKKEYFDTNLSRFGMTDTHNTVL